MCPIYEPLLSVIGMAVNPEDVSVVQKMNVESIVVRADVMTACTR